MHKSLIAITLGFMVNSSTAFGSTGSGDIVASVTVGKMCSVTIPTSNSEIGFSDKAITDRSSMAKFTVNANYSYTPYFSVSDTWNHISALGYYPSVGTHYSWDVLEETSGSVVYYNGEETPLIHEPSTSLLTFYAHPTFATQRHSELLGGTLETSSTITIRCQE